jgi:uncharacterized protein YqgQ
MYSILVSRKYWYVNTTEQSTRSGIITYLEQRDVNITLLQFFNSQHNSYRIPVNDSVVGRIWNIILVSRKIWYVNTTEQSTRSGIITYLEQRDVNITLLQFFNSQHNSYRIPVNDSVVGRIWNIISIQYFVSGIENKIYKVRYNHLPGTKRCACNPLAIL